MKKLLRISRINFEDKYMIEPVDRYIGWGITKNCTYNCKYCIYSCKNNNIFSSLSQLKIACDYFNNISSDKSWIAVYGGEPTTHPNFLDVVDMYKFNVKIYTNLYKDIGYLDELVKTKHKKLRILTSIHPKRTKIKELLNKVEFLLSHGATVEIKCMFTGEDDEFSFEGFKFFRNSINDPNFRILPRTVYTKLPNHEEYGWYFSELFLKAREIAGKDLLFEFLYDDGEWIIHDKYDLQFEDSDLSKHIEYKHLVCDGGDKYISVLDNFNIYPCCRYDEDFYNQKPLGNVLTNPYYRFKKQICKLPFCFPPEEDFLLKRRIIS